MIPKVIHYCWFGGAELPLLAQQCLESWKKHCPDYRIVEWNEENYPLENAPDYVKEAISAKRWAFATDYIRLDVVYQYGGVYLDTDVELVKSLDPLLEHEAFFGRDRSGEISTGLGFGAHPGNTCVRLLRDDYIGEHFQTGPVSYDLRPCPQRNKKIFDAYAFSADAEEIEETNGVVVYPKAYFAPMDAQTKKIHLTEETYSIHHFAASWKTEREQRSYKRRQALIRLLGVKVGKPAADVVNRLIRKMYKVYDYLALHFR